MPPATEVQSPSRSALASLVHAAYVGSSFPSRCLSRSGEERGNRRDLTFGGIYMTSMRNVCGISSNGIHQDFLPDFCWIQGMLLGFMGDENHPGKDLLVGEQFQRLNHPKLDGLS